MKYNFSHFNLSEDIINEILNVGSYHYEEFEPFYIEIYLTQADVILYTFEFSPSGEEFDTLNDIVEERGYDANGYGWTELLVDEISKNNLSLSLHITSDSESETCALQVFDKEHFVGLLNELEKFFNDFD